MSKHPLYPVNIPSPKRIKTTSNVVDNSIDLPKFSTAKSLSSFIESNPILGDIAESELNNLSYTSKSYGQQKTRAINRFYAILSRHKSLNKLSEFVVDPKSPQLPKVTRYVLLCRGLKKPSKNKIVNACMMLLAVNLRKSTAKNDNLDWSSFWVDKSLFTLEHANACYQPDVTSLFHRQLFKYFHDEGILFSLTSDFNYTGGFQAYWSELFALVKAKRPNDFGERPNKASYDIDGDFKIRNLADPPFTPYALNRKGYDDCMILMCHYTCVDWCLRGATEVRCC